MHLVCIALKARSACDVILKFSFSLKQIFCYIFVDVGKVVKLHKETAHCKSSHANSSAALK